MLRTLRYFLRFFLYVICVFRTLQCGHRHQLTHLASRPLILNLRPRTAKWCQARLVVRRNFDGNNKKLHTHTSLLLQIQKKMHFIQSILEETHSVISHFFRFFFCLLSIPKCFMLYALCEWYYKQNIELPFFIRNFGNYIFSSYGSVFRISYVFSCALFSLWEKLWIGVQFSFCRFMRVFPP